MLLGLPCRLQDKENQMETETAEAGPFSEKHP